MKKCGVVIEGQEYEGGRFLRFLDGTKVEDFYDEAEARDWVDENAFDEALELLGLYPDEAYIRESGWKNDHLYAMSFGQSTEGWYEVTFDVVSYGKGSD